MPNLQPARFVVLAAFVALSVSCGEQNESANASSINKPSVVVSTSILGDVVTNVVGDQMDVFTIMPIGADPHLFQPSAQQAGAIEQSDVVILNGAGFEEGILEVVDAAEESGVPVFEAIGAVETLDGDAQVHEGEAQPAEDGGHESTVDPHFFTDPARMAEAVEAMVEFLIQEVESLDAAALRANAQRYIEALNELDSDVVEVLSPVVPERRVLITNHEVFAYFADRYDFEVVGTIIPSGTTGDGTSAKDLADLVAVIKREQVTAIFADASASTDLVDTLAAEAGAIEVVELFSESLGDADSEGATYIDMIRTNAARIAASLT